MNRAEYKEIHKALLSWYGQNKRALPWRNARSLYGTWVSEIMLQQTTVAAVIPFWERFMALFPDVEALAQADEESVLAAWSGLGYYLRARNIHKAARVIVEELAGQLPTDSHQWKKLPGVGVYASGAIASIGLGEVVPAVDANAKRVLSRWHFDNPDTASQITPAKLEKLALEMVPPECPGSWNEAVMELGAVVCRADSAHCQVCPVLDHCAAGLAGVASQIPFPKKATPKSAIVLAVITVYWGNKVLIFPPGHPESVDVPGSWEVGRHDTSGLHQGLWSLPSTFWFHESAQLNKSLSDPGFVLSWVKKYFPNLSEPLGAEVIVRGPAFSHSITNYCLKVHVWEVDLKRSISPNLPNSAPDGPGNALENKRGNFSNIGRFAKLDDVLPISKLVTKALKSIHPRNV